MTLRKFAGNLVYYALVPFVVLAAIIMYGLGFTFKERP